MRDIVPKGLYLLLAVCMFLLGCASDTNEVQPIKEPNLSQAAAYNVQLGLAYLKRGNRPRAKNKLLKALAQEPQSPAVYSALAYFWEQTNEPIQAEKYYLRALSLAYQGPQLNNYGAFLCRRGEYSKAEQFFLKATQDTGYLYTAGAYENAGLCSLLVPNDIKARRYFLAALAQDPSRKNAFYELVKLERKAGHRQEAFALVQKHSNLIWHDKILLSLAKDISKEAGHEDVAVIYENKIKKMDSHVTTGGENNEYNNHV